MHIFVETSCLEDSLNGSRDNSRKVDTMLTDRNIDKKTARYWCLFCNTAPRTLNEAVMTRLVNPSDDLARAYKEYDHMTDA